MSYNRPVGATGRGGLIISGYDSDTTDESSSDDAKDLVSEANMQGNLGNTVATTEVSPRNVDTEVTPRSLVVEESKNVLFQDMRNPVEEKATSESHILRIPEMIAFAERLERMEADIWWTPQVRAWHLNGVILSTAEEGVLKIYLYKMLRLGFQSRMELPTYLQGRDLRLPQNERDANVARVSVTVDVSATVSSSVDQSDNSTTGVPSTSQNVELSQVGTLSQNAGLSQVGTLSQVDNERVSLLPRRVSSSNLSATSIQASVSRQSSSNLSQLGSQANDVSNMDVDGCSKSLTGKRKRGE